MRGGQALQVTDDTTKLTVGRQDAQPCIGTGETRVNPIYVFCTRHLMLHANQLQRPGWPHTRVRHNRCFRGAVLLVVSALWPRRCRRGRRGRDRTKHAAKEYTTRRSRLTVTAAGAPNKGSNGMLPRARLACIRSEAVQGPHTEACP